MSKIKLAILAFLALLVGAGIVYAMQTYVFPSKATLGTVEVAFWLDKDVIASTEEISWGNITYDSTYLYNFTVQNTGTARILIILTHPGLDADWTLTWAGNESVLDPGEVVSADLTLTTPAEGISEDGDYTWDICVTAEEI